MNSGCWNIPPSSRSGSPDDAAMCTTPEQYLWFAPIEEGR